MNNTAGNYYLKHKKSIIKKNKRWIKISETLLLRRFPEDTVKKILTQCECNFDAILPGLPYIGGKKNTATGNLLGGAYMLALIQSLEPFIDNEYEIGQILYELIETNFYSIPGPLRGLAGKLLMSKFGARMAEKKFQKKQFEHLEGGWATDFVPCNGEGFLFGLDVKKCGICKLFKKYNAEKYTPFACLGDYPMFGSLGVHMHRTKTLAHGEEVCNYRFYSDREPLRGWPPEQLEEWKNGPA